MINLFKKNIGKKDKDYRIIGGTSLIVLGVLSDKPLIKLAGCTFLFTGVMQKCVFYDLLNIDTYNR
jgi:hypothetical protein